ncbi:symmetrical bis(5'-nucleosyl)-tetraphosphatase [Methylomonas sp. DH-1]|uniref:symmetrical bis(5'-nucleosyl)-tetraphosphatase n=1 Tax=Methylomonas sp. (strain DH-1) TaxID=1727196 RepID=UPI0007C936C0|nr:symmetrical bis(5'-nucleosyl)-tetraphosphatase [Methylomonas sp. DH-1]ANE55279.1 bis(5'-nucleosyl)-tetraphosphatase (symmetrical) [Methylomonas sp. DH-1]
MAVYAIGSIGGNFQALRTLLDQIGFDPASDRVWLAGNLAGDGEQTLEVLRFVKSLGKSAASVLGDRDLQLLSAAAGFCEPIAGFEPVLAAPDRDELLKWLRQRGLIHHDAKLNYTLVHAGIPAEWSFSQAITFTYEVESVLSQSQYQAFLENHRQDQSRWHAKLRGWKRLNFIANACTRMKYCNAAGKLDFNASGPVAEQNPELMPWYRLPDRQAGRLRIVFADDAGFQDQDCSGVYPLPAVCAQIAVRLADR